MGGVGRLFIAGTSATRRANHAFADIGTRASPRAEISGLPLQGREHRKNGAVTSAVLVHQRVEPPHFDWRSRERPALALLAWEA